MRSTKESSLLGLPGGAHKEIDSKVMFKMRIELRKGESMLLMLSPSSGASRFVRNHVPPTTRSTCFLPSLTASIPSHVLVTCIVFYYTDIIPT